MNDFMIAACNAMDDANAAAQLNLITPTRTFEEMVAARANKYSGEALYKQVIADAQAEMVGLRDVSSAINKDGFCFAAGTLVHTKEGLVPIENVKIGDWVLSQPEGTGELAYKRVVRTTKFESKPVYRVSYYSESNPDKREVLIVTGNHPFYVAGHVKEDFPKYVWGDLHKRIGWRRADLLKYGELLLLASGELVRVGSVDPIWRSRTEGVGWIDTSRWSEAGSFIDLRDGGTQETLDLMAHWDFLGVDNSCDRYDDEETADEWAYKCAVYNFEVEDFHTYYVGELGVWVHNTNCFEDSLKPFKAKKGSYFLARSLMYKNPLPGGANVIKLGDGATYIRTGGKMILSEMAIDAQPEMPGMRDVSGALSKDGFCFAAGTLVHTKEGLVPIENIKIGDWVLSQPEQTGERAYKRVVRTTRFEDKAVYRVRCYSESNGGVAQSFIATVNHPFFVADYDKNEFPKYYWPQLDNRKGWQRADSLMGGALLELASGELISVSSVDPIWRTKTEGVGWIGARDYEVGHYIDLRDGQLKESYGGMTVSDLLGVDDFNERYETEEQSDKWAYKCDVYNFEVEDFHTYYVGELGVWVHNTNCFEELLKPCERKGRLTSPELKIYYPIADVNALIKTMDKLVLSKTTIDTQAEMLGMRNVSDAIKKEGFCFAAGTLVHTKEGLVPIENVKIGDWVLSQPEQTGELAYKRVVRTTRFEDKAVFRVMCYSQSRGVSQNFIVTGNHPFFVAGYIKEEFPKYYWPQLDSRKGWQRADSLKCGELLELANGELISVSAVDQIWRSRTEGVGYIGARDYEVGDFIDLRGGKIQETHGSGDASDFLGIDDFNERYEDEELTDKWAYKCAVHNFEVEDFHTYYVGELGVWVHNTNCFEDSLKPFKAKKGSYFLARSLMCKNPLPGDANVIKLGDDAAYIRTGGKMILSEMVIDAQAKMPGMRDVSGALSKDGFCFAAGTLVHTKEGLVPIENIKIGDWVLSQPEQTGELAYKRVVRTTRFESKPVYRVRYYLGNDPNKEEILIVSGNHPFYVAGHVKEEFSKSM